MIKSMIIVGVIEKHVFVSAMKELMTPQIAVAYVNVPFVFFLVKIIYGEQIAQGTHNKKKMKKTPID